MVNGYNKEKNELALKLLRNEKRSFRIYLLKGH